MIGRRNFMLGAIAALCAPALAGSRETVADPVARLQALEQQAGGRLGAFVLDTGSGRSFGLRSDERFCHCSTFKLSLAAMALHEADAGRIDLDELLAFGRADLQFHSPVVEANLDKGALPILALAEAIQVTSDNAAANVLMRRLGGPEALTRFWRGIGDEVSRIDGYEPEINVIPPGTQENSTTPRAMAGTLQRIVLGDVLAAGSRERLRGWMGATRTGMRRIRAGLPPGWRGLDKTGTGMRAGVGNKTNDVAIVFPPGARAPLVVTAYFEHPVYSERIRSADEAVLKGVGEAAAAWVG
ncbi:class A beta-lactamase [Luteimonas saliphila]|uniref:class A beta-lactamase n=1 Tax=Luteimonas saliphila TaxID=2804919 RepID=UPI00192D5EDC|nr:class A beta-lactamase [Luteimonas saliphila]